MLLSIIAASISSYFAIEFKEHYEKAKDPPANALAGEDEVYSCMYLDKDIAIDVESALDTNITVYMILTVGCFLSCMSGPILVLRWLSVPFHLLVGVFMHLYAIFVIQQVFNSDGFKWCTEPNILEDAAGAIEENPSFNGTIYFREESAWIEDILF